MLRLAVPVVLAELGWMSMGIIDTIMVAPLGPAAIGAAGIGSSMHMAFAIFGMGLLLGLDTLVSQAYGAGDHRDCHRWLVHGLLLATVAGVPVTGACLLLLAGIPNLGFHPAVMPLLHDDRKHSEGLGVTEPPLSDPARRSLDGFFAFPTRASTSGVTSGPRSSFWKPCCLFCHKNGNCIAFTSGATSAG